MQNKEDILVLSEPIRQVASKLAKTLEVQQIELIGYPAMRLILEHYKPNANLAKQEYYKSFDLCNHELFFRISQPLMPKQANNPRLIRKNAHKYQVSDCSADYTVALFDCDLKEIYGFWSHNAHLLLSFSGDYTDIHAAIKITKAERKHLLTGDLFPVKAITLATFEENPLYIFRFYEALIRKFKFSSSLLNTISTALLKEETFNRWKDTLAKKFRLEKERYGEIYLKNLNDVNLMKKIANYNKVYLELNKKQPLPNLNPQLNSAFVFPLSSPETLPAQVDEILAPEPMIEIIEIAKDEAKHIPEPEPVVEELTSQDGMVYCEKALTTQSSWNFPESEHRLEQNETILDFSELEAFPDNDIIFQQESENDLINGTDALYRPAPTIEDFPMIISAPVFPAFEEPVIPVGSSKANQELFISPDLTFTKENLNYDAKIPASETPEKVFSPAATKDSDKSKELFKDFLIKLKNCPATGFYNQLFSSLPNCEGQTDKIMAYLQPVIRHMRTDFNFFLRAMGAVRHKEGKFKILLLGLITEDPTLTTELDSSLDTMVSRALENKPQKTASYSYDLTSLKLVLKNIETTIAQLTHTSAKTLIQILIKSDLQPPEHVLRKTKSDKLKPSKKKRASTQQDEDEYIDYEDEYIDDEDEYIDSVSKKKRPVKPEAKSTEKQATVYEAIVVKDDTKAINKKLLKRKRNFPLIWPQDKETPVNKHADSVSHKKRQIELADGTIAKQEIVKALVIEEPKEVNLLDNKNPLQPVMYPREPSNHIQLSLFSQKPTAPVPTGDKASEFFYKPPR